MSERHDNDTATPVLDQRLSMRLPVQQWQSNAGQDSGEGGGEGSEQDDAPAGNENKSQDSLLDRARQTGGEGVPDESLVLKGDDETSFDLANLPENLRGATAIETLTKVSAEVKKLTEAAAAMPKPPDNAKDYALSLSDDATPFFGDLSADPAIEMVRGVALKAGLTTEQFQSVIGGALDQFVASGLIEKPIDPKAEWESLGSPVEQARITGPVLAFVDKLEAGLKTDPSLKPLLEEAKIVSSTAAGTKLLSYLLASKREGTNVPNTGDGDTVWTRDKLQQARRDPRYDTQSDQYDPVFRKRVDDARRAMFAD